MSVPTPAAAKGKVVKLTSKRTVPQETPAPPTKRPHTEEEAPAATQAPTETAATEQTEAPATAEATQGSDAPSVEESDAAGVQ